MLKTTVLMLMIFGLFFSGCVSNQTGPDTGLSTPYSGTYVGTETFATGDYPIRIYIKENGKVSIVDADNIRANGTLNGNKFIIKRYGSSPMVFEGTITDSTITGVGTGNRFLGDGTFIVTLEE